MVDVKVAIDSAIKFAESIVDVDPYADPTEPTLEAIRVEEVDFSEQTNTWLITLGWYDSAFKRYPSSLSQMAGATVTKPRIYKIFHVDAEDGNVKKMMMREA